MQGTGFSRWGEKWREAPKGTSTLRIRFGVEKFQTSHFATYFTAGSSKSLGFTTAGAQ